MSTCHWKEFEREAWTSSRSQTEDWFWIVIASINPIKATRPQQHTGFSVKRAMVSYCTMTDTQTDHCFPPRSDAVFSLGEWEICECRNGEKFISFRFHRILSSGFQWEKFWAWPQSTSIRLDHKDINSVLMFVLISVSIFILFKGNKHKSEEIQTAI